MSGPKKSQWHITQARLLEIRQTREIDRLNQVSQIHRELDIIHSCIENLAQIDRSHAQHVELRVKTWIAEVESHCNSDLRLAWRGIRGIQSFIKTQTDAVDRKVKGKQRAEELARIDEEKLRAQEQAMSAYISGRLSYFDAIREEYPDLMSEGVEQRLILYKEALSVNPENQQTLKQIDEFKDQFYQQVEKHLDDLAQHHYLRKVLEEAVGGKSEEGPDGGSSISGSFHDSPITIHIHPKSKELRFEASDDGSCKQTVHRFLSTLNDNGVELGPIYIHRTGELINARDVDSGIIQRINQ